MDDLPRRLRDLADLATEARPISRLTDAGRAAVRDAANEIERLRLRVADLERDDK